MNPNPQTVALVSLGCAKNAVDLQIRAGKLIKQGFALSPDPDRADLCIVNTCAFIESAREEAEAEIVRALELKHRGNYGKVVVTGCYPKRYPKARGKFPGVDGWEGVPDRWEEPPVPGLRFTGKAFAYLKIAEGCAHRCAYCAIPAIRGKYRSRPLESILAEAKTLLATGCRELNIVAQDPMLYGCDLKGRKTRLTDLLWRLDELEGDFWVRVLYSYPSEITEEFIGWLVNSRHAARYVDVPLQHTVPAVLEKMGRKSAIEATRLAADLLRDLVPGITLRTTIMTGFPGETEARFNMLLSDLRRMQFDHLGCFAYSPEEGTRGAKLGGRPSRKLAEARQKAVMGQAQALWSIRSKRLLGQEFKALVVAPGIARMESQAPDVDGVTYVDSDQVGEFVRVRLVKVKGFDFEADTVR
ncbi:MAG: radical SAM protein [Kiritimatiellae bacterium]|nr:radical SAM protein [Kiritimatiellia bacterium]